MGAARVTLLILLPYSWVLSFFILSQNAVSMKVKSGDNENHY